MTLPSVDVVPRWIDVRIELPLTSSAWTSSSPLSASLSDAVPVRLHIVNRHPTALAVCQRIAVVGKLPTPPQAAAAAAIQTGVSCLANPTWVVQGGPATLTPSFVPPLSVMSVPFTLSLASPSPGGAEGGRPLDNMKAYGTTLPALQVELQLRTTTSSSNVMEGSAAPQVPPLLGDNGSKDFDAAFYTSAALTAASKARGSSVGGGSSGGRPPATVYHGVWTVGGPPLALPA